MKPLYNPRFAPKSITHGFTLIEMLVVVSIIAVLASVSIPAYTDYVIRAKLPQAHAELAACQTRLEQRFQDTRSYVGVACSATDDFSAPVIDATANTYTVTMSGKSGGQVASFSFTTNNFNVRSSTVATGGPAGWSGNTACWVRQKGGKC